MKFTKNDVGSVVQVTEKGKRQGFGATKRKPHADIATLIAVLETAPFIRVRRRACVNVERYHESFWEKQT